MSCSSKQEIINESNQVYKTSRKQACCCDVKGVVDVIAEASVKWRYGHRKSMRRWKWHLAEARRTWDARRWYRAAWSPCSCSASSASSSAPSTPTSISLVSTREPPTASSMAASTSSRRRPSTNPFRTRPHTCSSSRNPKWRVVMRRILVLKVMHCIPVFKITVYDVCAC